MSRGVIIDAGGIIRCILRGAPTMFAQNLRPGESLFVLGEDDNGCYVDDECHYVDEDGNFATRPDKDGSYTPTVSLYFAAYVEPEE